MKTPMPPLMACCRLSGIAVIRSFLILVTVIKMFSRPQRKTIASASCQEKPSVKQTV